MLHQHTCWDFLHQPRLEAENTVDVRVPWLRPRNDDTSVSNVVSHWPQVGPFFLASENQDNHDKNYLYIYVKFMPKRFSPNHESATQSLFVSASYPSSLGTGQKANVSIGYKPISSGKNSHKKTNETHRQITVNCVFPLVCLKENLPLDPKTGRRNTLKGKTLGRNGVVLLKAM